MVTIKDLKNIALRIYKRIFPEYNLNAIGKKGNGVIIASKSDLITKNLYLDDCVILQGHINFISNKGKLFVKKYSVISAGCIVIPGAHKLKVGVPFYYSALYHIGDNESDITINEDCWVGAGCILLPGINIGRGAVIGAGSVVTRNIPPYAVAVGSPAKVIASKFKLEEIIAHEEIIYKEKERIPQKDLKKLFDEEYKDKPTIGDSFLTHEESEFMSNVNFF